MKERQESFNLLLKGHWNKLKGKVKQGYAQITDDDLLFVEGKEEELLGRLQEKTGKSKEEIRHWITRLSEEDRP